jgi:hypothetical protein
LAPFKFIFCDAAKVSFPFEVFAFRVPYARIMRDYGRLRIIEDHAAAVSISAKDAWKIT